MAWGNGSEQDGWRCCYSVRQCKMDKMVEWRRENQSSAFTEMSHSNANHCSQLESINGSRAFTAAKTPVCTHPHFTALLCDSYFMSLNSLCESSIWHIFTVEGLDIQLDTDFAKCVIFWVNNPIASVWAHINDSSSELVSLCGPHNAFSLLPINTWAMESTVSLPM